MSSTETSDRSYWERHARSYDTSLKLLGRPMPRMLALVSEAVRGVRVLEVAAGTGLVTKEIARSASEVVATDYAEAMVAMLERRLQEAGLENVRCERADLYALPFEPGTFDVVVAANVLHLVPDLEGAIRALRQVLAPGGRLVVPTFCHDETKLSWLVSRALAMTGFPGHRRFTARSLRSALETSGLCVLRSERLPGLIPIGYVEGTFDADRTA